jgi:chorismate dehydratase
MATLLAAARDGGVRHLSQIAAWEAPALGISIDLAQRYFRDNLHFTLGPEERRGLLRFHRLCVDHGLAPRGRRLKFEHLYSDGCPRK